MGWNFGLPLFPGVAPRIAPRIGFPCDLRPESNSESCSDNAPEFRELLQESLRERFFEIGMGSQVLDSCWIQARVTRNSFPQPHSRWETWDNASRQVWFQLPVFVLPSPYHLSHSLILVVPHDHSAFSHLSLSLSLYLSACFLYFSLVLMLQCHWVTQDGDAQVAAGPQVYSLAWQRKAANCVFQSVLPSAAQKRQGGQFVFGN